MKLLKYSDSTPLSFENDDNVIRFNQDSIDAVLEGSNIPVISTDKYMEADVTFKATNHRLGLRGEPYNEFCKNGFAITNVAPANFNQRIGVCKTDLMTKWTEENVERTQSAISEDFCLDELPIRQFEGYTQMCNAIYPQQTSNIDITRMVQRRMLVIHYMIEDLATHMKENNIDTLKMNPIWLGGLTSACIFIKDGIYDVRVVVADLIFKVEDREQPDGTIIPT